MLYIKASLLAGIMFIHIDSNIQVPHEAMRAACTTRHPRHPRRMKPGAWFQILREIRSKPTRQDASTLST